MWPRKRIDIGWGDLAFALGRCLIPRRREDAITRLEQTWAPRGDALACLSVRSGFDLLWTALDLPPGDEVLVSAVTIADMGRIIEAHGLVPVPVDLVPETMSPNLRRLESLITPRTRAIVVAHLFGSELDLEPIIALARRHNLLVIEDCAQAYVGPQHRGHAESDVAMFSFGSIKTATVLGGALLRIRDRELLARMRRLHAEWPVQRQVAYANRVLKYSTLKLLGMRGVYEVFVRCCGMLNRDFDQIVNDAVRGFAGPGFFDRIRRQPCSALAVVLQRRLRRFDDRRLAERARKGRLLVEALEGVAAVPGAAALRHTHWVFPILTDDPQRLIAALRGAGFDATQGQSMIAIAPPADRPQAEVAESRRVLRQLVYLPFYPNMPDEMLHRMAEIVATASDESESAVAAPVAVGAE